jgi:hypothetical protein
MGFQRLNVLAHSGLREVQHLGGLGVAADSVQDEKGVMSIIKHCDHP